MDRIDWIMKLHNVRGMNALKMVSYMDKPRRYTEDDCLYMREVHFAVLIGELGTPTMGELALKMGVTQGAVTQLACRLETKGYVERRKDMEDKRVTIISLTEKGQKLCDRHIEYDRKAFGELSKYFEEFSDEDLKKLMKYEQIVSTIFCKE